MTKKLLGIGVTAAAVALAAVFAIAQDTRAQGRPGGPPAVQGPPPSPGSVGPASGPGGDLRGRRLGRAGRMGAPGREPQAGSPDRAGAPGRGGFAALNLTDDQRTTIQKLQRASRDQAVPIEDELEFTRRTLHRELFADKRDNGKVTSLSAKAASLEKQLTDLRVKSEIAMADVLTPEQRETMRVMEPGRRGIGAPRPLMRERLNARRPN